MKASCPQQPQPPLLSARKERASSASMANLLVWPSPEFSLSRSTSRCVQSHSNPDYISTLWLTFLRFRLWCDELQVLVLKPAAFANVDIRVRVSGGGHASQVYAIRQAIGKAIVAYTAKYEDAAQALELKKALVSYDRTLLVADPRRCEPKKFGGPGQFAYEMASAIECYSLCTYSPSICWCMSSPFLLFCPFYLTIHQTPSMRQRFIVIISQILHNTHT